MIRKILFIHGLASSGAFKTAVSLHRLFRPCEVIAPDVPIEPDKALDCLAAICEAEKPDLIVGLSLGGFLAQKLRGYCKVLVNPDLHPSRLLRTKLGEMKYLSPRKDGADSFFVTEEICEGYSLLEERQFKGLDEHEISLTKGLFADKDEIVDCAGEFEKHYPDRSAIYPGNHLPTHLQLKAYLVPLVESWNDYL